MPGKSPVFSSNFKWLIFELAMIIVLSLEVSVKKIPHLDHAHCNLSKTKYF